MKKALILSGFSSVFFIGATLAISVHLYKTKEIPFLNDTFQGLTSVLGYKPEIVQQKIEKEILYYKKKEEAKANAALEKPVEIKVDDKPAETTSAKPTEVFNSVETPKEKEPEKEVVQQKVVAREEDPFNSVETDEKKSNTGDDVVEVSKHVINAVVDKGGSIVNDGTIMVRLVDKVTVNGKTFPKNFAFQATTSLLNGRYTLITDALGVHCKNFEGDQEGTKITSKNLVRKGEVTLSEWEPVTFIYITKN